MDAHNRTIARKPQQTFGLRICFPNRSPHQNVKTNALNQHFNCPTRRPGLRSCLRRQLFGSFWQYLIPTFWIGKLSLQVPDIMQRRNCRNRFVCHLLLKRSVQNIVLVKNFYLLVPPLFQPLNEHLELSTLLPQTARQSLRNSWLSMKQMTQGGRLSQIVHFSLRRRKQLVSFHSKKRRLSPAQCARALSQIEKPQSFSHGFHRQTVNVPLASFIAH